SKHVTSIVSESPNSTVGTRGYVRQSGAVFDVRSFSVISTCAGGDVAPSGSVPENVIVSVPPPIEPGAVYVHTSAFAGSPPTAGTGSASDPSVPDVSNENVTASPSGSKHASHRSNFSPIRTPCTGPYSLPMHIGGRFAARAGAASNNTAPVAA